MVGEVHAPHRSAATKQEEMHRQHEVELDVVGSETVHPRGDGLQWVVEGRGEVDEVQVGESWVEAVEVDCWR